MEDQIDRGSTGCACNAEKDGGDTKGISLYPLFFDVFIAIMLK